MVYAKLSILSQLLPERVRAQLSAIRNEPFNSFSVATNAFMLFGYTACACRLSILSQLLLDANGAFETSFTFILSILSQLLLLGQRGRGRNGVREAFNSFSVATGARAGAAQRHPQRAFQFFLSCYHMGCA
jgi:hypothetical protein